jgi:hypothetical protein
VRDDLDLDRVLPYLKPAAPAARPVGGLRAEDTPVTRPFIGSLVTTYVLDQGEHFAFVAGRHVAADGRSLEELHRQAVDNLGRRLFEYELRLARHHAITPVLFDGNFEAATMLVDNLWNQIQDELAQPDIIAVAPARDILAFCPSGSSDGRTQLTELIDRVWPAPDHRLTRDVYRRVGGAWRVEPG